MAHMAQPNEFFNVSFYALILEVAAETSNTVQWDRGSCAYDEFMCEKTQGHLSLWLVRDRQLNAAGSHVALMQFIELKSIIF